MAGYNPSFAYQSKVVSSEAVDNTKQIVSSQADQSNTIGSINVAGVGGAFGPIVAGPASLIPYLPDIGDIVNTIGPVLTGGLATGRDILSNTEFQCSLVMLANQLACGGAPSCPSPKSILALKSGKDPKTGKPKFEADCGCPDDDAKNLIPDDNDISTYFLGLEDQLQSVVDNAGECLRKARNAKFMECLENGNFNELLNALRGNGYNPWDEYLDILLKEIDKVLSDPNRDAYEKAADVYDLLTRINTIIMMQGWDIDPGLPSEFTNAQNAISDLLNECAGAVSNDCVLNSMPDVATLRIILDNMSRKPEKQCKGKRLLNDACECVCPSGTVPCPDTNDCIKCEAVGETIKYIPGTLFNDPYCECQCPEGTEKTYIQDSPTEISVECLPICPPGMRRKTVEKIYGEGGVTWKERECKCRKNVGSWDNPKYALVPSSACDLSINDYGTWVLDGYKPDPNNNCECGCFEKGYVVHTGTISILGVEVNVSRCRYHCPFKTRYDWDSDSCVCEDLWGGPCPNGSYGSAENPCQCVCSGVNKVWNPVTRECLCSEQSVSSCVGGRYDAETCACSSGSYSFSSLTLSELSKIASNFGYSLKSNIDLL